jgi:hypothetical protein
MILSIRRARPRADAGRTEPLNRRIRLAACRLQHLRDLRERRTAAA